MKATLALPLGRESESARFRRKNVPAHSGGEKIPPPEQKRAERNFVNTSQVSWIGQRSSMAERAFHKR